MRARAAALLWLACALAPAAASAGDVEGHVRMGVEGADLAAVGPVAVFLVPASGAAPSAAGGRAPSVHQRDARFQPAFLIVSVGETVRMPNDDVIFHNVFSLSKPNAFDLGIYPAGELRTMTFAHPGLVKLYCSIHASMRGAILVVPTPWFSGVSAAGAFKIRDVPPGSYELRVWNERLPLAKQSVTVGAGPLRVDVALGSSGN